MFLQKLPTCKRTTTSLSLKTSLKLSKIINCNTKETINEDMKSVTSDPIQDTPDFEKLKIHQSKSNDYINAKV